MSAPARLAAFVAALAVVLGVSFGAARALDVDLADDQPAADQPMAEEPTATDAHAGHEAGDGPEPAGGPRVGGLASDDGSYRLQVGRSALAPGQESVVTFSIRDAAGAPLTSYDVEHAKRMHLIVVRRDLAHFQHLHPELGPDGTWTQRLTLPAGGTYRMIADFTVDGDKHSLGTDLSVPGSFTPVPLPAAAARTSVDGYTVTLDADPHAGQDSVLEFQVRRDGRPVADLEPYLGARGHLVALREGDLAYLHVHPTGDDDGNSIRFAATFPTPGTYRLFLQFQHGDVHTAGLTLAVHR